MSFAVSLDKRGEHMRALDAKKKRYQKDKEKHDKVYDDILSTQIWLQVKSIKCQIGILRKLSYATNNSEGPKNKLS